MELIISRLKHLHEGMDLSLKDHQQIRPLALINGNKTEFKGPIILFNIDQHTIYGLSHPAVVSRLFNDGPQQLLTTRELAHSLFEHGMKASLGQVKIKNSTFYTRIDTFYTVVDKIQYIKLIMGKRNKPAFYIQPRKDYKPIVISTYNFQFKDKYDYKNIDDLDIDRIKVVEIDHVQDYITAKFEPY